MPRFTPFLVAAVAAASFLAPPPAAEAVDLKTDDDKAFYAIGVALSRNLSNFDLTPAELDLVKAGLTDGVDGKANKDVDLQKLGPKIQEISKNRSAAAAEKEKKASESYLTKAAAEKGATKTDSGLILIETKAGSGKSPKATDKVKVHYHGTLTDGTVFDSSKERGEPVTFPLNGVIPCWTEGVQKMKVGGKAKLVCPSDLAYGDQGRPSIPGGATLVFEVELLDVTKGGQ